MAVSFSALEPTFANVGDAPAYRVRFFDPALGGAPVDPDSVDALEVVNSLGVVLRTYIPPDIVNTALGTYEVQDTPLVDAGVLTLRWTYTVGADQFQSTSAFVVQGSAASLVEAQIKRDVQIALGSGVMRVELPGGTLDYCLMQAKRWFAMYLGQSREVFVNTIAGQQTYDVTPDCQAIFNVSFEDDSTAALFDYSGGYSLYGPGGFYTADSAFQQTINDNGFFSAVVLNIAYNEMGTRIMSQERRWSWSPYERKLWLYPCPTKAGRVFVEYVSGEVNLSNPHSWEYFFIQQYTLALAKETLGRIRSKYSGFSMADGERNLDGDTLLSEASEMKESLEEKLIKYAPTGWIIQG